MCVYVVGVGEVAYWQKKLLLLLVLLLVKKNSYKSSSVDDVVVAGCVVMFTKRSTADVKKSTGKIQDSKKDSATRLRHIKTVLGEYCNANEEFIVGVPFDDT